MEARKKNHRFWIPNVRDVLGWGRILLKNNKKIRTSS
jgi:hypothetical protein